MRALCLLIASLLLVSAAEAQGVEPAPGERALVVLGGTLGAAGAAAGTYQLFYPTSDTPVGATFVVLSIVGGLALGTTLVAEALGLEAPLDVVAVDALLAFPAGALAGVVVGGAVAGLVYLPTMDVDYNFLPAVVGGGIGALTAVAVTGMVASRRIEATPAVLAAPTSERAPGLSLRVGL